MKRILLSLVTSLAVLLAPMQVLAETRGVPVTAVIEPRNSDAWYQFTEGANVNITAEDGSEIDLTHVTVGTKLKITTVAEWNYTASKFEFWDYHPLSNDTLLDTATNLTETSELTPEGYDWFTLYKIYTVPEYEGIASGSVVEVKTDLHMRDFELATDAGEHGRILTSKNTIGYLETEYFVVIPDAGYDVESVSLTIDHGNHVEEDARNLYTHCIYNRFYDIGGQIYTYALWNQEEGLHEDGIYYAHNLNQILMTDCGDLTIHATFVRNADPIYSISAQYENGILAVNGRAYVSTVTAAEGERVLLTATPDEGYEFVKYTSDDVAIESDGTFVMPAKNVTIRAHFRAISVPEDEPEEPEPTPTVTPVPTPIVPAIVTPIPPTIVVDDDEPEETEEPEQTEEPAVPERPESTPDTPSSKPENPAPPDDIVITPPVVEPAEDTFFDRIEKYIPAVITVTGTSFSAGALAFLLLLFRKKRTFHGVFSEISIPGTKIKGDCDLKNSEYWFIPEMTEKLKYGEISIAEYIQNIRECDVYTVFPSDTVMEVVCGDIAQTLKASEKEMFKVLSEARGNVTFRFTSKKTGMNFSITYDIR